MSAVVTQQVMYFIYTILLSHPWERGKKGRGCCTSECGAEYHAMITELLISDLIMGFSFSLLTLCVTIRHSLIDFSNSLLHVCFDKLEKVLANRFLVM